MHVANNFAVVLDANVLYPFRKRDILLRFAHAGSFAPVGRIGPRASGQAVYWRRNLISPPASRLNWPPCGSIFPRL